MALPKLCASVFATLAGNLIKNSFVYSAPKVTRSRMKIITCAFYTLEKYLQSSLLNAGCECYNPITKKIGVGVTSSMEICEDGNRN